MKSSFKQFSSPRRSAPRVLRLSNSLKLDLHAHLSRTALLPLLLLVASASATTQVQTTAFTYQGRLTDAGSPANGAYDLQFKLYDALSGPTQIGATATFEDVAVSTGTFSVTLDFGAAAFPGANRWLEIEVRPGVSTGAYTTLTPRQPITSTPYAINAAQLGGLAASGFLQNSSSQQGNTNFNISGNGTLGGTLSAGSVGIGTTNPQRLLSVQGGMNIDQANGNNGTLDNGTLATGNSLTFGFGSGEGIASKRNSGGNQYGLDFYTQFANRMSITSGGNVGIGTTTPTGLLHVRGASPVRILGDPLTLTGSEYVDFMARSSAFTSDLGGMRIQRQSSTGDIDTLFFAAASGSSASEVMRAKGGGNVGIGTTNPLYKLHVAVIGNHAIYGQSDIAIGVWGNSSSGTGVYGATAGTSLNAAGVSGIATASSGQVTGVFGAAQNSPNGTGVVGQGSVTGAYFQATGNSGTRVGVYGVGFTNGVNGQSSSGYGVSGTTASTGFNQAGVFGEATANAGTVVGVYGRAVNDPNGTGVAGFGRAGGGYFSATGNAGTGVGVYGIGDQTGVNGQSTNGTGVFGASTSGRGIVGDSASNDGIVGSAHVGGKSGVVGLGGNGANGLAGITDSGAGGYFQATASEGRAIVAVGDVVQDRSSNGLVKAMVYVNENGTINRCYNSQLTGSAARTAPCGLSITHTYTGTYDINFGFQVSDLFYSFSGRRDSSSKVTAPYVWPASSLFCTQSSQNVCVGIVYVSDSLVTDGPFMLIVH